MENNIELINEIKLLKEENQRLVRKSRDNYYDGYDLRVKEGMEKLEHLRKNLYILTEAIFDLLPEEHELYEIAKGVDEDAEN